MGVPSGEAAGSEAGRAEEAFMGRSKVDRQE
jgi:hypothetical protein